MSVPDPIAPSTATRRLQRARCGAPAPTGGARAVVERPALLAAALGSALFAIVASVPASAKPRQARLKEFADVYAEADEDSYVVQDGEEGEVYPIVRVKGDWVEVQLEGETGWIERGRVEMDASGDGDESAGDAGGDGEEDGEAAGAGAIRAVVKPRRAKLYATPDTDAVVVTKLARGTSIEVLERSEDGRWYKARYDGPPAWVRARDVRLVGLEQGDPVPGEQSSGDEHFRVMDDRELRQASVALGAGVLLLRAGVGEGRVRQSFTAHDPQGAYAYDNYQPPMSYDISTPGPAFSFGAAYWATGNFGVDVNAVLVWAHKGISVNDPSYTDGEARLTLATYTGDVGAIARYPFLREGAYFFGRVGYKLFQFDVDQANPDPATLNGAVSPLFWSMVYHGPELGGGMRFPVTEWFGVEPRLDVVPFAFARNGFEGGGGDTPSGNVGHAWGLSVNAALWFLVLRAPIQLDIELRGFYDHFFCSFNAPDGVDVPRANPPYLRYAEANTDEQSVGATASLALRF